MCCLFCLFQSTTVIWPIQKIIIKKMYSLGTRGKSCFARKTQSQSLNSWLMFTPLSRGAGVTHDRTWISSGSFWLKITPFGFRKILKFIKDEYGNPPVYVTENGISERGAVDLNDMHRTHYYKNYINQALKGIVHKRCFYPQKYWFDVLYECMQSPVGIILWGTSGNSNFSHS